MSRTARLIGALILPVVIASLGLPGASLAADARSGPSEALASGADGAAAQRSARRRILPCGDIGSSATNRMLAGTL
jgi:hypothetical protein